MFRISKFFVSLFSMLICFTNIYAFQTIRGVVINGDDSPIPYVNIGIAGKSIGTVSKSDGTFKLALKLTAENRMDTLRFSVIGFKTVGIRLDELELNNFKVRLEREVYELDNIKVISDIPKSRTLGIKRRSLMNISAIVEDENLGSEFVNLFLNDKKARIDRFRVLITKNPFPVSYFRVNIYNEEDEAPGKNILKENIFVEYDKVNGWLDVDLREYDIYIEGNFFAGIEWIEEVENIEERRLFIGGKLIGPKRTWVREVSQSEWEKVDKVILTMNAIISY